MKLNKKNSKVAMTKETELPEAAVANFNAVMDEVAASLVEREEEVNALKLCLLTREHLMLEGEPGVAKSKLAYELFARTRGISVFEKQLTSSTQPDEVFGCMNSKRYREEAVWEYNTKGMLPECHIGLLDEVYRVAKSFLSSLFSVMNERIFFNGGKLVNCPLMTIIGTTNFTTLDPELDAFHDRWLVKSKVKHLSSDKARIRMMMLHYAAKSGIKHFLNYEDLTSLQSAVQNVGIPESVFSTYENLAQEVAKSCKVKITDRRLAHSLKLAKAAYILDENRPQELDDSYLSAVRYGLIGNDEEHNFNFATVFERIIGSKLRAKEVTKHLTRLNTYVKNMSAKVSDPDTDEEELSTIFQNVQRIIKTSKTMTQEDYITQDNRKLMENSLEQTEKINIEARKRLKKLMIARLREEDEA